MQRTMTVPQAADEVSLAASSLARLRGDSPARWHHLERIIDLALDAPAEAREAVVHAHSAGDLALRDAALAWLRACTHAATNGRDGRAHAAAMLDVPLTTSVIRRVLEDAVATGAATSSSFGASSPASRESAERTQGAQVGSWRVLREIGRGGMGVVYLAERAECDVGMQVALKFMRHADALDAVSMRRFLDERRILASLSHPAIARLVDVGVDGDTPWLAMDYIAGVPIDVWCKERSLSIEGRIALFCEVVDAVQHAHARLVVHRDLKPANILVTNDGRPTLLDFGIAKLLDAGGIGAGNPGRPVANRTRPGWQPMTPAYASPEQKRGESPSTASDVFALGVLLHELLTGALPDVGVLPSDVATRTLAIDAAQSARLARRLRGDLDTIIVRAIDDEPARRYLTADALAVDLRRHLRGLPVHARRDSRMYRVRRLMARHPLSFTAAALAVVVSAGFTVFTAAQARQLQAQAVVLREQARTLRTERDKAIEVTQFLKHVLSSPDPYQMGAPAPSLRAVLDRGTADMEGRLRDRPEIRAQLYSAIAPAYFGLGDWNRAGDAAAAAVALRRASRSPRNADLAASLVYLANVRLNQSRAVEAEGHAREAVSIIRALPLDQRADSASALNALGAALQKQGRRAAAGEVLSALLQVERSRVPLDMARLAQLERNLAHVQRDDGRYADATVLYARAYEHHVIAFGAGHPESANSAVNLGYAHFLSGHTETALPLLRAGVAAKRRVLGLANPDVANDQLTLARVLVHAGRRVEASRLRAEAESVLVRLARH
ncbi:serine/threonine-protein kinase [Gemmatimonas sp.]|uniref:serine/threonine-protein kinase n=1 Tax=Gemmatimonas sp. TaxID=1962908 RepID=UPI00286E70B6|nr:serine/threonine-protein kinase [Gemmatimonas sp.]